MKPTSIMDDVVEAFGGMPRPEQFIRGTCFCDECLAHEAAMQVLYESGFSIDKLGHPGWDPICFASAHAYAYLLPGLVTLLLTNPEAYIAQFLFHLENTERIALFTVQQKRSLIELLDYLLIHEADMLEQNQVVDEVFRVRTMLA